MTSICLILLASALMLLSGLPACLMGPKSTGGQRISVFLMLSGGALGMWGVVLSAVRGTSALSLPWFLPWGRFTVEVDPLSAFFLCLVFIVPCLGSIYGLGYWKQAEHEENGQRLSLAFGLLAGAMALVVVARDGILFLIAWELMALAAYFASTAEDDNPEVRRAGWIYLIATHIGTLCLLALFALWSSATGSFALYENATLPAGVATALFVLAIVGFGFKAGIMPLHVWLPGAHANAPSHVSAVMSGVMLKMGIYGIVRMTGLMPVGSEWWGLSLLIVGAVTGIAGIAFAIGQRDIKRILAYSSIENIGIIAMGLGLALLGRFYGNGSLILLGFCGALFHVWNHGLFKPLMFMNAGAVIHATGTRDIELLGGLGKKMPGILVLFVAGAVAICALPPFNGFASEWLIYLGLFRCLAPGAPGAVAAASCAAVALSIIGALAVACFVKLTGTVFLGSSRSASGEHAHDPGISMIFPAATLALACAALGIFPFLALPLLERAARAWTEVPGFGLSLSLVAPTAWLSAFAISLASLAAVILAVLALLPRLKNVPRRLTWDCGYAKPTSRMQYSGTSFTQTIADLAGFILKPQNERPAVEGAFPRRTKFLVSVPDIFLERLVMPIARLIDRYAPGIRVFQQGQTHTYILYVVAITIILLLLGGLGGLS